MWGKNKKTSSIYPFYGDGLHYLSSIHLSIYIHLHPFTSIYIHLNYHPSPFGDGLHYLWSREISIFRGKELDPLVALRFSGRGNCSGALGCRCDLFGDDSWSCGGCEAVTPSRSLWILNGYIYIYIHIQYTYIIIYIYIYTYIYICVYGGLRQNGGVSPKCMVYFMENPSINGWFRGSPILENLHMG